MKETIPRENAPNTPMIRVLFVCLGNICRSPMAEAVLRHKIKEAGLTDKIEVDSAGTGGWHAGQPPHQGTRRVLRDKAISVEGMYARQIALADLDDFDYILTMDQANFKDVRALGTARGVVKPLLEYASSAGVSEVPDPYYTGGFNGVYELIDAACDGFLQAVRQEHGL